MILDGEPLVQGHHLFGGDLSVRPDDEGLIILSRNPAIGLDSIRTDHASVLGIDGAAIPTTKDEDPAEVRITHRGKIVVDRRPRRLCVGRLGFLSGLKYALVRTTRRKQKC